ncbi:MAG: hypothetical protein ACI89L_000185 [Phycisphaerales bacterium]|jgi:hypothetical protein
MPRTRIIAGMLALLALVLGAGCNIVGPVAYAIHGPGNVNAKYELDRKVATVIFVDDPSGRITDRRLRDLMAQTATTVMMSRARMDDMIDPTAVLTVASKDSFQNPLSIVEIGQAVGADVLIYVALNQFDLEGPGQTFLPTATLAVKVMDITEGRRVWPDGSEGAFIRVGGDYRPGIAPRTSADLIKAEEQLAAKAALGIAQLFYTHEITESVIR